MRAVLVVAIVGALSSIASAQAVSVTFTTTPVGGQFAPKNIGAVWIETSGGAFIKTIDRWANTRKKYLLGWIAKAGNSDTDAISGATRANHSGALTAMWDLKDKSGTVVPDGTYTLRMELADSDATSTSMNHEAMFTFVKSAANQTQSALSNGGFQAVTIAYTSTSSCGNSMLDPGETCDPPGSCPTSCNDSGDACAPSELQGTAATCTAVCKVTSITACVNGDGCCPAGCDGASDDDCGGGGGTSQGGCTTAPSSSAAWIFATCVGLLAWRRRRSR